MPGRNPQEAVVSFLEPHKDALAVLDVWVPKRWARHAAC